MSSPSWQQMMADERGTRYYDELLVRYDTEGQRWGIRMIILRGGGALCAYVGVPLDSPSAGWSYDDVPLDVHGGLTYSNRGDGEWRPGGYWWYGWDYGHYQDRSFYEDDPRLKIDWLAQGHPEYAEIEEQRSREDKRWLVEDVIPEARQAALDMAELVAKRWHPSEETLKAREEADRQQEETMNNMRQPGWYERERKKLDRLAQLGKPEQ